MRTLGMSLAEWAGKAAVPNLHGQIVLNCRYSTGVDCKQRAFKFGLSNEGALTLAMKVPPSRYIGLIEVAAPDRPIFDVVRDATETGSNPSVLACVRRAGLAAPTESLRVFAKKLGSALIK